MALVVWVGGCIEYFATPPDLGPIPGVDGPDACTPAVETCDGADNDCDGSIDEGIAGCDAGCDGIDDDGDGRSDEGCAEVRCGTERAGAGVPPCNGCPDGTVLPAGWVCIPPGVFMMGSPLGEVGRDAHEGPPWPVELTRPLLMQATEVTQGEWRALMRNNPSGNQPCDPVAADECPVEKVNWWEAVAYANEASRRDELSPCYLPLTVCVREPGEDMQCYGEVEWARDCEGYRLPTEAEWEYAARAGTVGPWSSGDDARALIDVAWYYVNSGDRTHPVGRLGANAWGLFDVHGNVFEWAWDWYGNYPAEARAAPVADPAGSSTGTERVLRGGSYLVSIADHARSARRDKWCPGCRDTVLGFRLARTAPNSDLDH